MEKSAIKDYLDSLQDRLCDEFTAIDDGLWREDQWLRKEGGGGYSRSLSGGSIIEKLGVNVSHIFGKTLPSAATDKRPELTGRGFEAMGLSLVVHPKNPYVPTAHANVRFFAAEKPDHEPIGWFGGGYDLTPYYGNVQDCVHWHREAKNACEKVSPDLYDRFKKSCDQYFYLPHRDEHRGIGGLFFDDFNELGFRESFKLMRCIGDSFSVAYFPILNRRKSQPFGERERNFQLYRRGRYVEFNLVYDRGTLFGLQTNGRIESILMSLPPMVSWIYDWKPQPESAEAELYENYLRPRDWI